MAKKERFLCGYKASVGGYSVFKGGRLGREGVFNCAISKRYRHGAPLSSLCYLLPCGGHLGKQACFTQESILPRMQSVKRPGMPREKDADCGDQRTGNTFFFTENGDTLGV